MAGVYENNLQNDSMHHNAPLGTGCIKRRFRRFPTTSFFRRSLVDQMIAHGNVYISTVARVTIIASYDRRLRRRSSLPYKPHRSHTTLPIISGHFRGYFLGQTTNLDKPNPCTNRNYATVRRTFGLGRFYCTYNT